MGYDMGMATKPQRRIAAGTDLAALIRAEVSRRGISAYRVAKDSGISISMAQRLLKGEAPRTKTAARVLTMLGLRIQLVDAADGK